ncbi:MAG: hypothetical protein HYW25_05575 [Candidatus Aenigmarchaeota archaeon]|nr:hypothetical protein [Candidatus Aenigmarchaeota archaeon]
MGLAAALLYRPEAEPEERPKRRDGRKSFLTCREFGLGLSKRNSHDNRNGHNPHNTSGEASSKRTPETVFTLREYGLDLDGRRGGPYDNQETSSDSGNDAYRAGHAYQFMDDDVFYCWMAQRTDVSRGATRHITSPDRAPLTWHELARKNIQSVCVVKVLESE